MVSRVVRDVCTEAPFTLLCNFHLYLSAPAVRKLTERHLHGKCPIIAFQDQFSTSWLKYRSIENFMP